MTPELTALPTPDYRPGRVPDQAGSIAFRLDGGSRRVLMQRASELAVSPHVLARHYVLELLGEAEERAALREAVLELQTQVNQLRADLALAVEALLVSAGQVPPSEARQWVEQNLPCSPSPNA